MPRSRDFERENKPRGRTRAQDAERKRRERAKKAKLAGREPGQAGRPPGGARKLDAVFAVGELAGASLNPTKTKDAGEWTPKGAFGMRKALRHAFLRGPMPCRVTGETHRAYAGLVRRVDPFPPKTPRKEINAACRELARSMAADLRRAFPDLKFVLARIPRRLESTPYGLQRRGGHGIAVLVFVGTAPRSIAYLEQLESRIAAACGWQTWERTDEVPFTGSWRLLHENGEPRHRVRTPRQVDLRWLAGAINRLRNGASAVEVGTGIGRAPIPVSSEISTIDRSETSTDTRPHFSPVRREIPQKNRGIVSFVVAEAAA